MSDKSFISHLILSKKRLIFPLRPLSFVSQTISMVCVRFRKRFPILNFYVRILGKPLSAIPDPFGTHESFAAHNNAKLREFLDRFDCEYEFQSATEWYRSGKFDDALRKTLESYEKIQEIILPTLGPERARTYSPFLPISPASGRVLQVPIVEHRPDQGTIVFQDEDGITKEVPVTGGHCKLQWKPDWAMRWHAMKVDYEMYGKDLMSSHALSAKICRVLGRSPPQGFHYELFLDEEGRKISKSRGKGFSVEEMVRICSA